jgi:hypothetical protein
VRASPTGQLVDSRLGEFDATGSPLGADTGAPIAASADWQLLSTTFTAEGGHTLDVRFRVQTGASAGDCFQIDSVCLLEAKPGCPR